MTNVSRRSMLRAVAVIVAAAAPAAQACTITAQRIPTRFSDRACRRSLRRLVDLINAAHTMSDDELTEQADDLGIEFHEDVTDPLLNYPTHHPIEHREVVNGSSPGQTRCTISSPGSLPAE